MLFVFSFLFFDSLLPLPCVTFYGWMSGLFFMGVFFLPRLCQSVPVPVPMSVTVCVCVFYAFFLPFLASDTVDCCLLITTPFFLFLIDYVELMSILMLRRYYFLSFLFLFPIVELLSCICLLGYLLSVSVLVCLSVCIRIVALYEMISDLFSILVSAVSFV